jgi:hypothetical protein
MERERYSLSAVEFETEVQEMAGAYARGILSKSEYDDWCFSWTRDSRGDFINSVAVLRTLACENVVEDTHAEEGEEEEGDGMCIVDFGEGLLACLSGAAHGEYLTIEELAQRLKVKPKTIRNKMASGILVKGIHYFSPSGLGPRFKWSAVEKWIEGAPVPSSEGDGDGIPMARGYVMEVRDGLQG